VLAIVLLGAIVPLALVGLWLTRSAARSGRALLDGQLRAALASFEQSIAARWEFRRGDLLLLAENQVAREILARGSLTRADSQFLQSAAGVLAPAIPAFVYRDAAGRSVFAAGSMEAEQAAGGPGTPRPRLLVRYPVGAPGTVVGSLEAQLYLDTVVPSDSAGLRIPGGSFAVRDQRDGSVPLRLGRSIAFPPEGQDARDPGEVAISTVRLADPPFDLAVAAPVAPYVAPFVRDARVGFLALLAVALLAGLLSAFFTGRLSRSIGGLVDAAGAVAGGDLNVRTETKGPLEFQRLSRSFNAMTDSLRRLVSELSERRALAAVGEFAAELAHEVRNALTSVQIDLDRVEERTEDARNRELVTRTLAHVRRLDAAVTGSLRIARSGRIAPVAVALGDVIQESLRVAESSFVAAGARLRGSGTTEHVVVQGDPGALHQLFLNILLNAQQALGSGGEATVSVTRGDGVVVVSVVDTGPGMPAEQVEQAFKPYYTTRPNGTGLGLPIARQIAIAHGGQLAVRSRPGGGTTVDITLPLAAEPGR
jgi:signal transduction histidine kinase